MKDALILIEEMILEHQNFFGKQKYAISQKAKFFLDFI